MQQSFSTSTTVQAKRAFSVGVLTLGASGLLVPLSLAGAEAAGLSLPRGVPLAGVVLIALGVGLREFRRLNSAGTSVVTLGDTWFELPGQMMPQRVHFDRVERATLSRGWNATFSFTLRGQAAGHLGISKAGFSRSDWHNLCASLLQRLKAAGVPCQVRDRAVEAALEAHRQAETAKRQTLDEELRGAHDELSLALAAGDWATAERWFERLSASETYGKDVPVLRRLTTALRENDPVGAFFEIYDGYWEHVEAGEGALARRITSELQSQGQSTMATLLQQLLDDSDDDEEELLQSIAGPAVSYYRAQHERSPEDTALLETLIEWLKGTEQPEEALAAIEILAALPGQHLPALVLEAETLRTSDQPAKALERLRSVSENMLDQAEDAVAATVLEARGRALQDLGKVAAAREAYQEALSLDPDNGSGIWLILLKDRAGKHEDGAAS